MDIFVRLMLFLGLSIGIFLPKAEAQSFRYIDESGNIFFVEKPEDVPTRYRDQVVKPTPLPILTKQQQRQIKKDLDKKKRLTEKEEIKKKKKLAKEMKKKEKVKK